MQQLACGDLVGLASLLVPVSRDWVVLVAGRLQVNYFPSRSRPCEARGEVPHPPRRAQRRPWRR